MTSAFTILVFEEVTSLKKIWTPSIKISLNTPLEISSSNLKPLSIKPSIFLLCVGSKVPFDIMSTLTISFLVRRSRMPSSFVGYSDLSVVLIFPGFKYNFPPSLFIIPYPFLRKNMYEWQT